MLNSKILLKNGIRRYGDGMLVPNRWVFCLE